MSKLINFLDPLDSNKISTLLTYKLKKLLDLAGSAIAHEMLCGYSLLNATVISLRWQTARKYKIRPLIKYLNFTSSKNLFVIAIVFKKFKASEECEKSLLLGTISPQKAVSTQTISEKGYWSRYSTIPKHYCKDI